MLRVVALKTPERVDLSCTLPVEVPGSADSYWQATGQQRIELRSDGQLSGILKKSLFYWAQACTSWFLSVDYPVVCPSWLVPALRSRLLNNQEFCKLLVELLVA